jgi:hypothetical protein
MIRPAAFGYNEQTAGDNYFQHSDNCSLFDIQRRALEEFNAVTEKLTAHGVDVFVADDALKPHTPDAVFPNNWVSFHEDGTVIFYPMFAPNRRLERRPDIIENLREDGFQISREIDYSPFELEGRFLEGTGSMVLDRTNGIAYASLSERTCREVLYRFCSDMHYKPVVFYSFQTVNGRRRPIYHTNVMMCVADTFAVVCLSSIDSRLERALLRNTLENTGKEVIEISEQQLQCFTGNMLQIENRRGEKFMVMSETAYRSLSAIQAMRIGGRCKMLHLDVSAIETAGGGGIRCMMAELFLPFSSVATTRFPSNSSY